MDWISVKDRLPDAGPLVWTYTEYSVEIGIYDDNGCWIDAIDSGAHDDRDTAIYGTVTHWMPVVYPDPPEGE